MDLKQKLRHVYDFPKEGIDFIDITTVLKDAEAFREAEEIRGQGDAEAASIYAAAYNKDPEFYSFYRSLQAYRESFSSKSDVLVLDPDSEFFRFFQGAQRP